MKTLVLKYKKSDRDAEDAAQLKQLLDETKDNPEKRARLLAIWKGAVTAHYLARDVGIELEKAEEVLRKLAQQQEQYFTCIEVSDESPGFEGYPKGKG